MDNRPGQSSAADAARQIMRSALKASLATLEAGTGIPYASLVTVAHDVDGSPLLLLSALALHTRNLEADSRASLLFDASDGAGDPLAGGRVTVIGRLAKVGSDDRGRSRARFLARQPSAEMYSEFADFAFWRLAVERAHYIGGFGRIVDLTSAEIVSDLTGTGPMLSAEAEIITHMNEDHLDAVQLFATMLAHAPAGDWRLTGIDPAGIELSNGERGLWLQFEKRITTPKEAREALVSLTNRARRASLT